MSSPEWYEVTDADIRTAKDILWACGFNNAEHVRAVVACHPISFTTICTEILESKLKHSVLMMDPRKLELAQSGYPKSLETVIQGFVNRYEDFVCRQTDADRQELIQHARRTT